MDNPLPQLHEAKLMLLRLLQHVDGCATMRAVAQPVSTMLVNEIENQMRQRQKEFVELLTELYASIPNVGGRAGWRFVWRETIGGDVCEQDVMVAGYVNALAQWSAYFNLMPDDCAAFSVTRIGGR